MNQQTSPEQIRASSAKMKKTILITLCIILSVIIVLGGFAVLLTHILSRESESEPQEYYFYPITGENIFETGKYSEADMQILYCADPLGYAPKEAITDADRESFDIEVRFLEIYLKSIISGDRETYRTLFTEEYLRTHEIPEFTQQMLYHMCIYYWEREKLENGAYRVTYKLDYMIRENNGTFRRDVGSDAIRSQYAVLCVTSENIVLIDDIYTIQVNTKQIQ